MSGTRGGFEKVDGPLGKQELLEASGAQTSVNCELQQRKSPFSSWFGFNLQVKKNKKLPEMLHPNLFFYISFVNREKYYSNIM